MTTINDYGCLVVNGRSLWEAEELVDHGASSVYGLGTTRQLTAAAEKAATRDLSSATRQRRPKTPPLVRVCPLAWFPSILSSSCLSTSWSY
jgi:hypothetical protein